MLFAISSHATFRSLWLINVPAAPASRRVSGGIHPVVGPGSTASTCCANTGAWTSFATCAMSVAGGQSTIDAPVSSATAANRLARSQPFLPRTSGWVLKFRTIAGRRIEWGMPSGEIALASGGRRALSPDEDQDGCKDDGAEAFRPHHEQEGDIRRKRARRNVKRFNRRVHGGQCPSHIPGGDRADEAPPHGPSAVDSDREDLVNIVRRRLPGHECDGSWMSVERMVGDGLEDRETRFRGKIGDSLEEDRA